MIPTAAIRQYAVSQQIGLEVADQEVVLHYVMELLRRNGLTGYKTIAGESVSGPLLFKGGTALRKCVFGQSGRFSQDVDLDATHKNGFEAAIDSAFSKHAPFFGISFSIPNFRYSQDGNFSGSVTYQHEHGSGNFELQISYRLTPILESRELVLQRQTYFERVEFEPPRLHGLDPYEMIAEKLMACNRRRGGSAKDVYDLYLWSQRPFDSTLVQAVAVLKAWTDQRRQPQYDPVVFLTAVTPANYRWDDLEGLVPRRLESNREEICRRVRERFAFLAEVTDNETAIINDQAVHRELRLFDRLCSEARGLAATVNR
jgi:predicted nucleotidyltransferase component of viral defense system